MQRAKALRNHTHDFTDIRYIRTDAEKAANVTVVNYYYPECYVDRYGTNTVPGTTSMVSAFNAAIKVAKRVGRTVRYGISWPYFLDSPVDCTTDVGAPDIGFTIRGEGQMLAATINAPYYPGIIAKHTGYVFDCSGAQGINWEDVTVGTDATTYPKTIWFNARNAGGGSQSHTWNAGCRVIGKVSVAVVYDYGSENTHFSGSKFQNSANDAGACVGIFTSANIKGLTSTFITIATGTQPTTAHKVDGGIWTMLNASSTSPVFYLENITSITVDSPFVLCLGGRSQFFVDMTNGPTSLVTLDGIQSEFSASSPTYGIEFSNHAQTPARWRIDNCNLSALTSKIQAPVNVVCDSFYIDSAGSSGGSANINIAGTLQNSRISDLATAIAINVCKASTLNVTTANLTVTTFSGGRSCINGVGTDTWSPNTATLTHGGTLTVDNKTISYAGGEIIFTFNMSDSVSITCAAGTAISGLPRANVIVGSGQVNVNNDSASASIGTGWVSGTSVKLPAFAVSANITVSVVGRYFFS